MLLIPAALAADLDATKLLRAATKGKDAAAWFDADAAFVYQHRAGFVASSFDYGTKGRQLRDRLDDPGARELDMDTLASEGATSLDGCKAGATSRRWTASAGAAPEILLAWPERKDLQELALVPLTCAAPVAPKAIGLSRGADGAWRIAAFLDTDGVDEWTTFGDEAARDVPAEREAERTRLTTELTAEVLSWSPPTLPVVARIRDDLDGDGLSELGAAGTHLYRSATGAAEPVSGAVKVIVAGDVDGDGAGDVLVDLGDRLQVRFGGEGGRTLLLQDNPRSSAKWLAADLDGDGRSDLVEVQTRGVRVWFDGRPYLGASISLPAGAEAVAPAVDLDGDGIDDVAIGMPTYGDRRGGVLILHGVRGSPLPRTTAIVGGYRERLGERLSANEAGLLIGTWSGLTRRGRVDLWGGDGRLRRQDIAPGLLVDECPTLIAGPEAGEAVALCRSKLRRFSGSAVQELAFSALAGAAATPVRTPDGLRIAAWTKTSLNFVGGPDWAAGPTVSLPRPVAPEPAPNGVVGGVLGGVIGGTLGGGAAGGSADAYRNVHWSEAQMKRRPTPAAVPLPEGVKEERCVVTVFLDVRGVPERVAFKKCPEYLQEVSRTAIMAAAWYPFQPPQPVRFDFNFVYRKN